MPFFYVMLNTIDFVILEEYSSRHFLIPKSIDIEKFRMYTKSELAESNYKGWCRYEILYVWF